jgi:hypothetical protein
MTNNQENRLSSYRASEKVMDDNNAIWNGIPAIVTTKTAFSAKIVAIQAASQQQDSVITGISTDKQFLKTALVDITTPVASGVIAFASQTNNNELLEQVNFTRNDLLRTRDDLIGQRCQNIRDRANDNLVALAAYGITAPVLAVLQTAINNYVTKVPAPRSAQANKKATTTNVKNLFKETDKILKLQLDKLLVQFKATNLNFFNAYTNAREIIDLGSTTAKVRGTVEDKEGVDLAGVTFVIRKSATGELVGQTNTKPNGSFGISNLLPGDYDFTWSFPTYQTKTESNVHVSAGKEVQRKITLLKLVVTIPPTSLVIDGKITSNATGLAIVNATVTINEAGNPDPGVSVNTDASGNYHFQAAGLDANAPFVIHHKVEAPGFVTQEKDISMTTGQKFIIDVVMNPV